MSLKDEKEKKNDNQNKTQSQRTQNNSTSTGMPSSIMQSNLERQELDELKNKTSSSSNIWQRYKRTRTHERTNKTTQIEFDRGDEGFSR